MYILSVFYVDIFIKLSILQVMTIPA